VVSVYDVLTVAVLAFIGVRIASGTRLALTGAGRGRVGIIVRGLRLRHFIPPIPVLSVVVLAVIVLVQIPLLNFGWWSALGGVGNPVTGNTERTAGTALEWLIPLCFIVLLVPALPLFAEAEERIFRLGSEQRTQWQRFLKGIQFGLIHALIGIPIGAALALSIGGWYFTWWYLWNFRRTNSASQAMLESTRAHLAYNLTVVVIILALVLLIPAGT
jgi:hypothetical protein